MKKTILLLTVVAVVAAAALGGCDKQCAVRPEIGYASVSDCHHPDPVMYTKDSDADSIVVSWPREEGPMTVTHYNMNLDCGSGEHIVTTVEMTGSVVTVTEHVGEQGLTDCFCFYDNTFQLSGLPQRPFTLVVQVEDIFMGLPGTTAVYQHVF